MLFVIGACSVNAAAAAAGFALCESIAAPPIVASSTTATIVICVLFDFNVIAIPSRFKLPKTLHVFRKCC
jgi:hypothetical protein